MAATPARNKQRIGSTRQVAEPRAFLPYALSDVCVQRMSVSSNEITQGLTSIRSITDYLLTQALTRHMLDNRNTVSTQTYCDKPIMGFSSILLLSGLWAVGFCVERICPPGAVFTVTESSTG